MKKNGNYFLAIKNIKHFLQQIFFCWTFPLFLKGAKSKLNKFDLKPPSKDNDGKILGDKLEELWKLEILTKQKPSISRVLWKLFKHEIIFYGFLQFIVEMIVRLSQPLAIWKLIDCFRTDISKFDPNQLYYSVAIIIISTILSVFLIHISTFHLLHVGLKMRIACSSLIYRKSLKLNRATTNETTTGLAVNILSNDMNRLDKSLKFIHYLWIAPLQTVTIIVLLGFIFNAAALTGCGVLFLSIVFQVCIGKFWSEFRAKTAARTDERVRLLSEIVSGIQVIKMYTWESIFIKLMKNARKQEIRYIKYTSIFRALFSSLNKFTTRTAVFLSILVYILIGNQINAKFVFGLKSFYTIFKDSMITRVPLAISAVAEAVISLRRIERFLLIEERLPEKYQPVDIIDKPTRIKFDNITAKWSNIETLTNINLTVNSSELIAIIGPVGSGKTSLLNVILDELPISKGGKLVIGQISYAAQEPWLFTGTIKENILFGEEYNESRYDTIIKICCLDRDLQQLPNGDQTTTDNVNLSGGQKARISLARCVYKQADIYLLDDSLSAMDTIVSHKIFDECICKFLNGKCCIFVTHQLQFLKRIDKIYFLKNGRIEFYGNFDDMKNSVREFSNLLLNFEQEDDDSILNDLEHNKSNQSEENCSNIDDMNEEFAEDGQVKFNVYWKYFTMNGCCQFLLAMFLCIFTQIVASSCDFFESIWINFEEDNDEHQYYFLTRNNCVYIYVSLILAIIFLTIIRSIYLSFYLVHIAQILYKRMFNAIVKTGMLFFNSNPPGRILNRFCDDIGNIDETLPLMLLDTLQIGLNVIAINIILALVNPWLIIAAVVMFILFYFIRMLYLATGRDLKRIEATARSPIFSHMNSTLRGLTTIRAFNVEYLFKKNFDNYLNQHTSAYFMSLSSSSTFGFWLDMCCSIYIIIVTTSCFWGGVQRDGSIGLAITQAFGLTGMFQWGMQQWSNLENYMTSVERVLEYHRLPAEDIDNGNGNNNNDNNNNNDKFNENNQQISIPSDWPKYGDIEFEAIYLKYRPELDQSFVLMNVSFKISPFEKVGIIGRTGAGKTSLISVLFRLIDYQGTIYIDGIDIKQIPLERLRSKITIIPQHPILFTGTIRENLDPFNQYNDMKIWQILNELELKEFIDHFPDGINTKIIGKGSNLSMGQRQLLCLVRALLLNNNILILDEPTASIDYKTDVLIQNIIRKKTENCTVLIIAHRLHTIMDCDKVIVMDGGRIIEFGHPHRLLQNTNGALTEFVSRTGKICANYLKQIAEKNFGKNQ